MFCVYGKSRVLAKKQIYKLMLKTHSDISVELKEIEHKSQTYKQKIIDGYIDDYFKEMKLKRCTHELSTPEIAYEALDIMNKDKGNFSECEVMKKVNKLRVSKTTNKPLMEWVSINTRIKQVE